MCTDRYYATFNEVEQIPRSGGRPRKVTSEVSSQMFPGYFDIGTPLIIRKNDHYTIIGMFEDQLNADGRRDDPALFTKLDPDAFEWIVKNADWTQEARLGNEGSYCFTHTSCSCGIQNGPRSRTLKSLNRIYDKEDNTAPEIEEGNKYPWEVNIYNRIDNRARWRQKQCGCQIPAICPSPSEMWTFDKQQEDQHTANQILTDEPDQKPEYDICGGSLITSKHILTTAECVARNREQRADPYDQICQQDQIKQDNSQLNLVYMEPECVLVLIGYPNQKTAKNEKAELLRVKTIHPHPKAFTKGYSYNLGNSLP